MRSKTPHLSVVIPAYNEVRRLPQTLAAISAYLARQPFQSEIIVADDGSTDETVTVARSFEAVTVLQLRHRGKGCTVRDGVFYSKGDYILICDADLATPIEEWEKLATRLQSGYAIAIGSREGVGAIRRGEPLHRHLMGRIFNQLVGLIVMHGIGDTQCGFKAFQRLAAMDIFQRVRLYGDNATVIQGPAVTAYDVEVLFLAQLCGYRVAEVPVVWNYGDETKVDPLRDSWRNLRDLVGVRLNAWRGLYGDTSRRAAEAAGLPASEQTPRR